MNLRNPLIKCAIALTTLLSMSNYSNAQFRLPGIIQRYQMGYSYPMAWAEYKRTDRVTTADGSKFDSTITSKTHSKFSFGGLVGTTIPVKRLGEKSMFAISIDMLYNGYLWDYRAPMFSGFDFDDNGEITGYQYSSNYYFDGMTVHMALPVGGDFKFGCDALADKSIRFCGTIGAGAYPSISATVDASDAGFGFGVNPYAKAEFGIMAGICFKIRAMYTFGNIPFYTEGNSLSSFTGMDSKSSLTGKQSLSLSLIFMPFSWSWKESGWWNSY